jgi:N-acetylglucosaminyldiphosphoundecaprenol N-acetyl-beta-D-mannosaminyltransferase
MTDRENAPATIAVRMAICGNIIERRDVDEVIEIIGSRLGSTAASLAVGSVNLDHLHHFGEPAALGHQTGPEWLLLADGMPIAWRGQALTAQPWPRVTGADLLPRVLAHAEANGYRVGFLGGSVDTHQRLAGRLARQYPRLAIAGLWSPSPHQLAMCSTTIAAGIRDAGTDILVVSLGKPRQEQWVEKYGISTGARLFLPFGAAVDFVAGTKRRAPGWMQRFGLEWFYRLTREPRRLARRYLIQGPVALTRAVRAELLRAPGVYYAAAGHERPLDDAAPERQRPAVTSKPRPLWAHTASIDLTP